VTAILEDNFDVEPVSYVERRLEQARRFMTMVED